MTLRARVDIDVIFQDSTTSTMTIGSLSEHTAPNPTSALVINGTAATAAVAIAGTPPLAILAIKNTGTTPLRLGGAIDVAAGRLAVIPTTATITVSAPSGAGSYSCIWMG